MKFDESFLIEVGLQDMPENQKQAFLKHAQEELEMRVGEKISDGMTDEQLIEFEGIMQNDQNVIRKLILEMKADFRQDETYKKLLKRHNVEQGTWEILGEYLSVKWIQKNRPNYREVVSQISDALKAEIRQNAEHILAQ